MSLHSAQRKLPPCARQRRPLLAQPAMSSKDPEDVQRIRAILDVHMKDSDLYDYRDKVMGKPMKEQTIVKHTPLLMDLRKAFPYIVKPTAEIVLRQKAKAMEDEWHLAQEAISWSERQSGRLRAMLRDAVQAAIKARGRKHKAAPSWVLPFLDSNQLHESGGEAEGTQKKVHKKPAAANVEKPETVNGAEYELFFNSEMQATKRQ